MERKNVLFLKEAKLYCYEKKRKNILCTISNEINGILAREGDKRVSPRPGAEVH